MSNELNSIGLIATGMDYCDRYRLILYGLTRRTMKPTIETLRIFGEVGRCGLDSRNSGVLCTVQCQMIDIRHFEVVDYLFNGGLSDGEICKF